MIPVRDVPACVCVCVCTCATPRNDATQQAYAVPMMAGTDPAPGDVVYVPTAAGNGDVKAPAASMQAEGAQSTGPIYSSIPHPGRSADRAHAGSSGRLEPGSEA